MCRFTGMKRVSLILIMLTASVLLLLSCSKGGSSGGDDDNGPHPGPTVLDTIAPSLVINTPTANQVFTSGSPINVTGRITDDLGLYRGSIRITDDANGNTLKEQAYEIHFVLSYDFSVSYTPTVTTASNYTVTVFFEDHGYNGVAKIVKIKVNP